MLILSDEVFVDTLQFGSVEIPKRTKTPKRTGIYQNALRLLNFYEHMYEFRNVILFILDIDTGLIILGFG